MRAAPVRRIGRGTASHRVRAGRSGVRARSSVQGSGNSGRDARPDINGQGITVCCHNFPDVLQRHVFPVLNRIGGVTQLDPSNTTDGSLCYRFHYDGQTAVLEDTLERELRISSTLSFRIERSRGTNMVDLVFDGGFD